MLITAFNSFISKLADAIRKVKDVYPSPSPTYDVHSSRYRKKPHRSLNLRKNILLKNHEKKSMTNTDLKKSILSYKKT